MNLYLLGTFAFAPLLLLMTPGPDLLTVIGRGIGQGRRAALVAVVGYALGDMIHTTFAVVGLSALIRASTIGFQVVKYTGAAYLIYLGIQAIRHKHQFTLHQQRDDVDLLVVLQQSIFASVLNPKTALFFLAFLPQFVDLAKGHARIQMIVLGGVFMVLGIVIYCPIAYFSGSIGQWVYARQAIADKVRWVTGSIFIALGIRVVLPERNH